jgi:hypothetical protein
MRMATLLITIGAIWMFLALLVVLALCGAAARPVPTGGAWAWRFDAEEEDLASATSFISHPVSLR